MSDDSLSHYGVPGMRWGKRKGSSGISRKEQASRDRRIDFAQRRRTISDRDLDGLVKRLEQEKKLRNLVDEDLNPGRTFVSKTIKSAGNKIAPAIAAGTAMYVVRGVITKNWSLSELASNIPKMKK